MKMSTDREWLLRMAALEDGGYVGAGIARELCEEIPELDAALALPADPQPLPDPDAVLADIPLPTYCGCNELLQDLQQLEAHVERGCWRNTTGGAE